MRFSRGHRSSNVEDRRGMRRVAGGKAKLGGVGIVIALIAVVMGKPELLQLVGLSGSGGLGTSPLQPSASTTTSGPIVESETEKQLVDLVHFALDDMQTTWRSLFADSGQRYRDAKLVLFRDAVDSACGTNSAAVGPFYCPADHKAYIDLSFYEQLGSRFGAPGDFAQAYVLAHEIGHHVQNLLGTSGKVHRARRRQSKAEANQMSVKLELQADCYAGLWAKRTATPNLIEPGDLQEGLRAAAAIGDDTLQKRAGARVAPESWTHGSSQQRVEWFQRGYQSGSVAACDTFL